MGRSGRSPVRSFPALTSFSPFRSFSGFSSPARISAARVIENWNGEKLAVCALADATTPPRSSPQRPALVPPVPRQSSKSLRLDRT